MRISTIIAGIVVSWLLLSFASIAAPPSDFSMTVISEPLHLAEPEERLRVDLDARGRVKLHAFRDGAGTVYPKRDLQISVAAVDAVYAEITSSQFFDLEQVYGDERVAGGDKAYLIVSANGRQKEVITVNIKVTDFDNIVRKLNEYLPNDRKVFYNAISKYVDGYREVQR